MSNLLKLAQDLEQKFKAQQKRTDEILKSAIIEHEIFIKQELNASAKRLNDAINDHYMKATIALNMLKTACWIWLLIVLVLLPPICINSGVLLWQKKQIRDNNLSLVAHEKILLKKEDQNERVLILPKGINEE